MPKPVRARTWRPPLPRPAAGPDAAEAARPVACRAGRAAIRSQHPSSLRARRGRSLPWCGERTFRAPTRHRAPNQEPGRILIPGDGAAGDQGAQNRPACPAMAATRTPAACPVSTTSRRYGLRRTCRLVTGRSHRPRSTWPNQARLAFLAVTHRYKRTNCLWLEPFQIADSARVVLPGIDSGLGRRSADSGREAILVRVVGTAGCLGLTEPVARRPIAAWRKPSGPGAAVAVRGAHVYSLDRAVSRIGWLAARCVSRLSAGSG